MSLRLGQRSFACPPPTSVCLIRNLLENQHELNSDSGGEEDFVPSKKDLESSDDEEEVADLDSDEEVVLKKGRRASSCQTPRSKQRSGASKTPRKTPSKVKEPGRDEMGFIDSSSCSKIIKFKSEFSWILKPFVVQS